MDFARVPAHLASRQADACRTTLAAPGALHAHAPPSGPQPAVLDRTGSCKQAAQEVRKAGGHRHGARLQLCQALVWPLEVPLLFLLEAVLVIQMVCAVSWRGLEHSSCRLRAGRVAAHRSSVTAAPCEGVEGLPVGVTHPLALIQRLSTSMAPVLGLCEASEDTRQWLWGCIWDVQ